MVAAGISKRGAGWCVAVGKEVGVNVKDGCGVSEGMMVAVAGFVPVITGIGGVDVIVFDAVQAYKGKIDIRMMIMRKIVFTENS